MTAQELIEKNWHSISEISTIEVENLMIEFAQYHVKQALSCAASKATMDLDYPEPYEDSNETGLTFVCATEMDRNGEDGTVEINKDSILNAYPLSQIK